ncbi:hypothetical protein BOX15_Mlig022890g1 [Macrostomum lignano]|uniref:RPGRIP1 C-terminal domain-containing protein n=1 Tax=Macrostomum lignano TaxID=282301 RepID=A0A267GK83_9PLAT|nr:hypothetical protein BOX15_Mlig022890g1 [Macrostomum lignano]
MDSDHVPIKRTRTRSSEQSGLLDRSLVLKWPKEELQDRFLTLYHEHSQLKEKMREQEDALKNSKLVQTKTQEKLRQLQSRMGASQAEIRATDQVVKLEMRLVELEKQNAQLHGRMALKNAQAGSAAGGGSPKRRGGYRGGSSSSRLQNRGLSSSFGGGVGSGGGNSEELQRLRQEVESLKEQLNLKDMELKSAAKDANSERETARIQAGGSQLMSMQEDLERVRMQRQLREKTAMVDQLQLRCDTLEERIRDLQSANSALMQSSEQSRLSARLRDEEAAVSAGSEAVSQATQKRLLQMELALEDARAEAQILRESNEKLIASAFDTQKERQWRIREMALMTQIRQLEAGKDSAASTTRENSSPGHKTDQNNAGTGPGSDSDLEMELNTLRVRYYDLQLKNEAMAERLAALDYRKRGISDNDFHAALSLVRRQQESAELQPSDLIFLKRSTPLLNDSAGTGADSQAQRRILELEVAHADAVAELDKARELLKAQQLLSADTKAGASLTEFRLQEVRDEYETRIGELNRLLEIRSARVRQLEEQLASRAYSSVGAKVAPTQLKMALEEAEAEAEAPVMPRKQRQAMEAPPPKAPSPPPAKASPAGSVVEEACVEQIQGVAESAYREKRSASQERPSSAQVVSSMAARLDAPPDRSLADLEASQSSDNESVHSVVPEPIKVKPRESGIPLYTKDSIKLVVDTKLRDLSAGGARNGESSLPPPPPYEDPCYGKPQQRGRDDQPQPEPRKKKLQPDDEAIVKPPVEQQMTKLTAATVAAESTAVASTTAEVDKEEADVEDRRTEDGDGDGGEEVATESDADSAVVVVVDKPSTKLRLQTAPAAPAIVSQCYVQVLELYLDPNSDSLANDDLDETACFVAFSLPGYDCEDTETPLSIKTPRPGASRDAEFTLRYNFKRTYDYNFDKNYDKRRQLASVMLLGDQSALEFSVVCEALDGSDFFFDLAKAQLPLDKFNDSRRPAEETLNVVSNGQIIGTLKVATDLPNLLRAVNKELPPSVKRRG